MFYDLPRRRPPAALVGPDHAEFWSNLGIAADGRHALVLGDTGTPTTALVVAGKLIDVDRYLNPLGGELLTAALPPLHQLRAGLTPDDWAALQPAPEPRRPVPADPGVTLITMPHTGLQVPHDRFTVTGYRELPTTDGVAFTATLRLGRRSVGTIQNEDRGSSTDFHLGASTGFGHRDLNQYAAASRTSGAFQPNEENILDDTNVTKHYYLRPSSPQHISRSSP